MSQTRERRAEISKATKALRDVTERRTGWQFDSRTGDAHMSIRPLVGTGPRVGCIAHVRACPSEDAETVYESIVTANNGFSQWPGGHDNPESALLLVEEWLQRNLMGVAVDEAASDAIEAVRDFLISYLGDGKGREAFRAYVTHLASKGK